MIIDKSEQPYKEYSINGDGKPIQTVASDTAFPKSHRVTRPYRLGGNSDTDEIVFESARPTRSSARVRLAPRLAPNRRFWVQAGAA
jgi:hypothetical protein